MENQKKSKKFDANDLNTLENVVTRTDKQGRIHLTINGNRIGHVYVTKKGFSWRAPFNSVWKTNNYSTKEELIQSITDYRDGNTEIKPEEKPSPKPVKKPIPKPEYKIVEFDYKKETHLIPKEFKYIERKLSETGTSDYKEFEGALNEGKNILLVGPTGSGKTTLARFYCAKNKIPYRRVSLNGGATVEDLAGHYILKDGETVWVDGIITDAARKGHVVVIDEINAAPSEVLFFLNPILDDERIIILSSKDGEVIKPHQNFRVVSTMNPTEQGYAGTSELNEALHDRFHLTFYIDYNESVERKILRTMGIETETINDVMKFTKSLRDAYIRHEIITPWSTRSVMNFAELLKYNKEKLILNRFKETEKSVVSDQMDIFVYKTKNPFNVDENSDKEEDGDSW